MRQALQKGGKGLAAVSPEVPGVQQGLSAPFHQQHITVKGGVVAEIGRDSQRAYPDRPSGLQKPCRNGGIPTQICVGCLQYLISPAPHVKGNRRVGLIRQPHVVPVGVGEKNGIVAAGGDQASGLWRDTMVPFQSFAGVQQDAGAVAGHLDQVPADLISPAEDIDRESA